MELLIIDKNSKEVWRIILCTPLRIHQIKLLIKTYNDMKDLKEKRVIVCRKIPSEFLNYHIVNIQSNLLEYMKNELLEKGIL